MNILCFFFVLFCFVFFVFLFFFFNVSRERAIERKDILRENRRNCIVLLNHNYLIIILFYFGLLFSI